PPEKAKIASFIVFSLSARFFIIISVLLLI
ncbi:unnamed protein product, partial [marine sediment metagenome]